MHGQFPILSSHYIYTLIPSLPLFLHLNAAEKRISLNNTGWLKENDGKEAEPPKEQPIDPKLEEKSSQ
jgi:hypothetical protein